MPELPADWGIGAIVLLLGALLGLRLASWIRRRRGRAASRRGARGERIAVRLLERAGYDVLTLQASSQTWVKADGDAQSFDVRADAIASRGQRRFVVEVKTGRAADLGNRNTRRQLLEYALAYPEHEVLLVDATRKTITAVEFPGLEL